MASLEEIERLYYKAMRDARLEEPAGGDLRPPGFNTEEFSRWARKVDVFRLSEGAADFAMRQHEEIVQEFGEYRRNLAERLSKLFAYDGLSLPGQLKDIGSCWDGSKVGTVNEMDSLYVMKGEDIILQENEAKHELYHVYLSTGSTLHEIKPRNIRNQFADKYNQLISELELPGCLEHGGYKSSRHNSQGSTQDSESWRGCVRYNGPAVTSQFLAKDKSLLTWDITPVVLLQLDSKARQRLRRSMHAIIADNPDKMFPPADVHLIPDPVENLWRPSTAQAEADTLRVLSKEGPMKKALSFCKVLSSRIKEWNDKVETLATNTTEGVKELLEYLEAAIGKTTAAEELATLDRKLRFAHIWIPPDRKEKYNEDKKSDISINNAAIKHILFKAACKRKGAFGSEPNMELALELIKEVFEVLGNDENYSSEHAFLPGTRISHFSVSASVAHKKHEFAQDLCRQCRILFREAMSEVLLKYPVSNVKYKKYCCFVFSYDETINRHLSN